MKVGELFAGVSGFGLGFDRAGYEIVFQVEIDKDCQRVNALHYPDAVRLYDVCKVTAADLPPCDVLVFGSPCQDMSVAGKREGLDGKRSGLFYEAIRIIRELRERDGGPRFVVWENVPGAISSNNGRDFHAVIGAFRDCGAMDIAWRVLDARFFGVAQRRRRLFVVCDFRGECAEAVLFEPEGVCRDIAEGEASGQGTAGTVALCLRASGTDPHRADAMTYVPTYWDGGQLSDTLDVSTLAGRQTMPEKRRLAAVCVESAYGINTELTPGNDVMPSLSQPSCSGGGHPACVAYDARGNGDGQTVNTGVASNLGHVGDYTPCIATAMAVRRLTPRECERLMGWPDGWTAVGADGKVMSDSTRYRMCGNGVVSNVSEWIAKRM